MLICEVKLYKTLGVRGEGQRS